MLLEFACSNHKSIRDEVLFSSVAGSDTTYEDKIVNFSGIRVLKTAVIYGANGSGKSNFIDAISFVKMLVTNSIFYQPGDGIRQVPHKLEGFQRPSSYRMQFVTAGIRYAYGFTLKNMLVTEEYLYYFPNGRQTKIFERKGDNVTAGSQFRGKFNSSKDILKSNRLFLSCAANFSKVEETTQVFRFFNDELVIYNAGNQDNWMMYSLYQMNSNEKVKQAVLAFLAELGTGIKDIRVIIDKAKLEQSSLPPFLSDEFKNRLLQETVDAISAKVIYKEFETDLMSEESTGIKKLFGMLCPLIDIMVNGKILFVAEKTPQFTQLIFTTHETGLLNLDLFRRDQIWFTELKTSDRATDLYSLSEIKNVRKEENFGRGYISGKYGAIPMLNLDFAKIVSSM